MQTDTYINELVEIILKLSLKTVQVHLIIWTTLITIIIPQLSLTGTTK